MRATSITGIALLVYSAFLIVCLGYLVGRVRIAGVGLGRAGVFLVSIAFGVVYSTDIGQGITQVVAGEKVDVLSTVLRVIEITGLVLFLMGAACRAACGSRSTSSGTTSSTVS